MSTKRQREWDASTIESSDSACVHGILMEVSPVKEGRKNEQIKYFHSEMTDGKKRIKITHHSNLF